MRGSEEQVQTKQWCHEGATEKRIPTNEAQRR